MTEVDEFIKKFNCENCERKDNGCELNLNPIIKHVCDIWKLKPCKHGEVFAECNRLGYWGEFPEKITLKCGLCDEEVVYIRQKKCGDCKWFESSKIYPCYHPHGVRKVDEFGYCSMWEKK